MSHNVCYVNYAQDQIKPFSVGISIRLVLGI